MSQDETNNHVRVQGVLLPEPNYSGLADALLSVLRDLSELDQRHEPEVDADQREEEPAA